MRNKILKSQNIIFNSLYFSKGYIAWTGGKDSTVILHLIKNLLGEVIWPVFVNDTKDMFEEQKDFITKLVHNWNLNKFTIYEEDKVKAIKLLIKEKNPEFIMTGIRWDEHEARANEDFFSPRNTHLRINPILHWTEEDVWNYTEEYDVPYCKLYDDGYRSLGEKSKTKEATNGERSGRELGKEEIMKELRKAGYW